MCGFGAEAFVSLRLLETIIGHSNFKSKDIELLFFKDLIDRFTCENVNPHHVSIQNPRFESLSLVVLISEIIFKMLGKGDFGSALHSGSRIAQPLKRSLIDLQRLSQISRNEINTATITSWDMLRYSLSVQILENLGMLRSKELSLTFAFPPSLPPSSSHFSFFSPEDVALTALICSLFLQGRGEKMRNGSSSIIIKTILSNGLKRGENLLLLASLTSSISIIERMDFPDFSNTERLFLEKIKYFQSEQSKFEQLNCQLEEQNKYAIEMKARLSELERDNMNSREKINELIENNMQLTREKEIRNGEIHDQLESLACKNMKLSKELSSLREELETQRNNHDIKEAFKAQIEEQSEELRLLKENLGNCELKNELLEENISIAKIEIDNLTIDKEALELTNKHLEMELKQINEEKSRIFALNVMLESKMKVIKKEIVDNHDEIDKENINNKTTI